MTWELSKASLNAVLQQHFFSPVSDAFHEVEVQDNCLNHCSCCGEILMIPNENYQALISRKETTGISNFVRSIKRHFFTHHLDKILLWISIDNDYTFGEKISVRI